jgi:hypothetical protein
MPDVRDFDIRDPHQRAEFIEQSRRENAEMRADMEARREAEPIGRPLMRQMRSDPMVTKDYRSRAMGELGSLEAVRLKFEQVDAAIADINARLDLIMNFLRNSGMPDDSGEPPAMSVEASAAWNDWWFRCFEPERESMLKGVAAAVLQMIRHDVEPLQKKIRSLERITKKGRRT